MTVPPPVSPEDRPRAPRVGLVARLLGAQDGAGLAPVLANLTLLFNTRAGDSAAAPAFGVPDLADLLHQFPAASKPLQQALRAAIARHEPRLRGVQVQAGAGHSLEISGQFCGGPVRIRAALTASGRIDLRRS